MQKRNLSVRDYVLTAEAKVSVGFISLAGTAYRVR